MDIQGLGYVGVRAKSLEDWTSFGTRFLGMQLIDRSAKSLALRMDDRKQRVVVSEDGGESATDAFKPGRSISGFRTGPLGMGHAVLHVKDINDAVPFYRDVLGFKLSDYMLRPFNAYFFHANPRHHSIAFIETGRNATHHLMVEQFSLD